MEKFIIHITNNELHMNKTKQRHLEKLATKMLKKDEAFQKLKEKKINNKFLDLF